MKKQIKNDKKWEEILKEFENILEQQKRSMKEEISGLALENFYVWELWI